ncbi:MAG TPA: c-type cytochrome [Gaiellaceae bacterium]
MRFQAAGLLALAVAALTCGCGQTGIAKGGDVGQGKQLFIANCAGCHTLADAGTRGSTGQYPTGPDLDGAFAGVRAQKFSTSTIKQVVYDQIYHAGAPMPQKLVKGAAAASVAAYVASVAGTGAGSQGAAPTLTATAAAGGGGTTGLAATGAALFTSYGCSGCHTLTGTRLVGPGFKGLYGSKVPLANGQTVTASDAYLLESILNPDKQIVKGYPKGVMSKVIRPNSVPLAKARALVAFIKSKK